MFLSEDLLNLANKESHRSTSAKTSKLSCFVESIQLAPPTSSNKQSRTLIKMTFLTSWLKE